MGRKNHTPDVIAALPGDVHHIERKTGLTGQGVRRILRLLHKDELVHIKRYVKTGGNPIPLWVLGKGVDAPYPKRATGAASCRAFRRRVKKAIELSEQGKKWDDRYNKHVSLHVANKTAKVGDPLLWALFKRPS